jgi:hypothetical protein
MNKYTKILSSKKAMKLINMLGDFFKKAPHLPKSWTKFLAKIMPWLALIGGIGSIIEGLRNLTMKGNGMGYGYMRAWLDINPSYFVLVGILSIITGFLLLMAFNFLKEKKEQGWIYLFWTNLTGILANLLGVIFAYQGVFGLVVGTLIGLWLVFEIKREYS